MDGNDLKDRALVLTEQLGALEVRLARVERQAHALCADSAFWREVAENGGRAAAPGAADGHGDSAGLR